MTLIKIVAIVLVAMALEAHNLTVVVKNLKNSNGKVQFFLYNKDGTIPDKELNRYYKSKRVSIVNKRAKVVFRNLPTNRYAVSLFHDENNNYELDKGLMLPKEGIGLSNFNSVNLFHLPNFKRASFLLDKDKKITIKAIYL